MVPRAERHARVQVNDDLVGMRVMFAPCRADHHALSDPLNVEELAPTVLPLVSPHPPLSQLGNGRQVGY